MPFNFGTELKNLEYLANNPRRFSNLVDFLTAKTDGILNIQQEGIAQITSKTIINIFNLLKNAPNIKHLIIRNYPLEDPVVDTLAKEVQSNQTLKMLDVTSSLKKAYTGTEFLFKAVRNHKTLKKLYAGSNNLGTQSNTAQLACMLNQSPLKLLDLSNNLLNNDELNLLETPFLRVLNLNSNALNRSKLDAIMMSLFEKTLLVEELDISGSHFNSKNIVNLMKCFFLSPTLKKLTVGGAWMDEQSYHTLGDFIKSHKGSIGSKTVWLDFTKTSLSSEAIFKIMVKLRSQDNHQIFRFILDDSLLQKDAYQTLEDGLDTHLDHLKPHTIYINFNNSCSTPESMGRIMDTLFSKDKRGIVKFKLGCSITETHLKALTTYLKTHPAQADRFEFSSNFYNKWTPVLEAFKKVYQEISIVNGLPLFYAPPLIHMIQAYLGHFSTGEASLPPSSLKPR